jgi:hypothetical protein
LNPREKFCSIKFYSKLKYVNSNGRSDVKQGCQIFLGTIYQNGEKKPNYHKIYKTTIKLNGSKIDHKIYQHLPLQDPPKFTQFGIFGLKINHLATSMWNRRRRRKSRKFYWRKNLHFLTNKSRSFLHGENLQSGEKFTVYIAL